MLNDDKIHYGIAQILLDEEGFWHVLYAEPDGLETNLMMSLNEKFASSEKAIDFLNSKIEQNRYQYFKKVKELKDC